MREIPEDERIEIRKKLLEVFHQLCEKNGLRYSLGYGTLLGAVRHKGMIPWDDDIDLILPRKDFDRLESIYSKSDCKDRYQFVSHRNHPEIKTKIGYFIDYSTVMIVAGVLNEYYGVHIDIYPVDILPSDNNALRKTTQKRRILQMLIKAKDVHPELLNGRQRLIRQIVKFIVLPINQDKVLEELNNNAKKYTTLPEEQRKMVCCYCESGELQCFPYTVITDYSLYDYDGKKYYGFKDYDSPLKAWYGDYMTPPKEIDRHRPAHKWVSYLYKDRET